VYAVQLVESTKQQAWLYRCPLEKMHIAFAVCMEKVEISGVQLIN
jgi:hypothetical protein